MDIKLLKPTGLLLMITTLLLGGCNLDPYAADQVFTDPQVVKLAKATKNGDIDLIETLLKEEVKIDAVGKDNLTPLYWSFAYVSPSPQAKKGFQYLLEKGANPMHIHARSQLPLLHLVARGDDSDYLKLLLQYGKNLDLNYIADDDIWPTALANAMSARRFGNFKMLINAGASIGVNSSGDETIFENAAKIGTWDYALYLLQQGADFTVGSVITKFNPEGLSHVVRSLESWNYWDYLAADFTPGQSDRDQVIAFLKNQGVEVYPYYKEDDPRYNPRPGAYKIEDPEPYFDFEARQALQTKETTKKFYDQYLAAKKFLNLIRRANAGTDDFKNFNSKININPTRTFENLIDWYAVDFFSANQNQTTRFRKAEIIKQLEENSGQFRDYLAQLSYVYSHPNPEYSATKFVVTDDEKHLFIKIGDSFGLLFTNEKEPTLKRIEAYQTPKIITY